MLIPPKSRGSKWADRQLSPCVGLISKAHIKDTRYFYEKVKHCKAKGRLLSLDVKSLFTNIPVNEVIEVIRDHSTGTDPIFSLPDPELFCDILKVCTSFNQFSFNDKYYRQITGVPMGSSLSPVLANIYMEHFETYLLEDIPVDLRPNLWLRYVDDIFCCFRDIAMLDSFLVMLNQIRPTIKFTFELSVVNTDFSALPTNVSETIPFLELNVMRTTDGNFSFSIYRKLCHAGNYLHAYSYQPLFQKNSVIRNLYLRAYRYCDTQFLPQEESRIQQDFLKLGYTAQFIEKCRKSAIKGRNNEVRLGRSPGTNTRKQEPLATLTLTYHPTEMQLRPQLSAMGIRLAFSTNSSLGRQLRRRTPACSKPKGSVYVVNCSGCSEVYIGQTGRQAENRMTEHSNVPSSDSCNGAVHRHNTIRGHTMDLRNPTLIYKSDCYQTRVTVEAALINVAPTVQGNTATACVDSNDLVSPAICRATKLNWHKLAHCIPHFNKEAIPTYRRSHFGRGILRPAQHLRSQPPGTPVAGRTRSQQASRSNLEASSSI